MEEEKNVIKFERRRNPNLSVAISLENLREFEEIMGRHEKLIEDLRKNLSTMLDKALKLDIEIR